MTMPAQKPGRSMQDVQTPAAFVHAVEERFGSIEFDLAASNDNALACDFYTEAQDALVQPWDAAGLLWLNPPYAKITPWASKCVAECAHGAFIAMLVPASVGANWFNEWVRPYAYVLELTPRLTFVGHKHAYPKDLVLAIYSPERFVGREAWHWRADTMAPANDNGVDPRQMELPILASADT